MYFKIVILDIKAILINKQNILNYQLHPVSSVFLCSLFLHFKIVARYIFFVHIAPVSTMSTINQLRRFNLKFSINSPPVTPFSPPFNKSFFSFALSSTNVLGPHKQ